MIFMVVFLFLLSIFIGVHTEHSSVTEGSVLQSLGEAGAESEVNLTNSLASLLFSLHLGAASISGRYRLYGWPPIMKQEAPSPSPAPTETFWDKIVSAFGQTGQAASQTADKWVNSEFEVNKAAGDVIPIFLREEEEIEAGIDSSKTDSSATELRSEFRSLVRATEATKYSMTPEGGILFKSLEDLAALVAVFTKRKLLELAREPGRLRQALNSYISDLESDLGSAKQAIVDLRREVNQTSSQLAEYAGTSHTMQAQMQELQSILAVAQKELEAKVAAEEELVKIRAQQVVAQDEFSELKAELEHLQAEMVSRDALRSEQKVVAVEEEIAKLKFALDQQLEAKSAAEEELVKMQVKQKLTQEELSDVRLQLEQVQPKMPLAANSESRRRREGRRLAKRNRARKLRAELEDVMNFENVENEWVDALVKASLGQYKTDIYRPGDIGRVIELSDGGNRAYILWNRTGSTSMHYVLFLSRKFEKIQPETASATGHGQDRHRITHAVELEEDEGLLGVQIKVPSGKSKKDVYGKGDIGTVIEVGKRGSKVSILWNRTGRTSTHLVDTLFAKFEAAQPDELETAAVQEEASWVHELQAAVLSEITVTFQPGPLGFARRNGTITRILEGQAQREGVKVGWSIEAINGKRFESLDDKYFEEAKNGSKPYNITFSTVVKPSKRVCVEPEILHRMQSRVKRFDPKKRAKKRRNSLLRRSRGRDT